jgi:hypothetical protein
MISGKQIESDLYIPENGKGSHAKAFLRKFKKSFRTHSRNKLKEWLSNAKKQ